MIELLTVMYCWTLTRLAKKNENQSLLKKVVEQIHDKFLLRKKRKIKERIFDEIGIPIEISDDPMTVVAKGTAIVAAEPLALEPEVRLRAMK